MMQCTKNKKSKQNKHTEATKIWKSSEASVSGRYNTPPLQEDLIPRSRMAPERNERGKTNLLLWQTSETKEPWEVEQVERKKATEMNEVKCTPLEKSN